LAGRREVLVGDVRYEIELHDPVRFAQTGADDIETDGIAAPVTVVVPREVTYAEIDGAVRRLAAAAFVPLRPTPRSRMVEGP
jgi:hypothetical protein